MSEHVYRKYEVTGSSKTSVEEAVNHALAKAAEWSDKLRWFEVTEIRGMIEGDKAGYWQVTVKVGADAS